MVLILKIIFKGLLEHLQQAGKDPHTRDLPLVDSYLQVLTIIGLYVLIVLKIGPRLMVQRSPFNVKNLIHIYNVVQIIFNFVMFCGISRYYFWQYTNFNWACMKVDREYDSKDTHPLAIYTYMYLLNKCFDLMDTIFFILRKKFNQVTFLHVYHHAIMIWAAFVYVNFLYGSEFTIVTVVNSFVHVIMYTYYFLSAFDFSSRLNSLKPYVTLIQILQFTFFTIKFFIAILNNSWCELPVVWLTLFFIQNLVMTAMFSNFYYKAYIVNDKRKM